MGLELEFTEGMQFDKGYLSPYMVTDPERMEAVLEDAYILIYQGKISAIADFLPLLEKVVQTKQAAARSSPRTSRARRCRPWSSTRSAAPSPSVAVKAPGFGDRRKAMLQDIAILTGGQVVSEDVGLKLDERRPRGARQRAPRVVTKDATTIVDGAGDAEAIQDRVRQIRPRSRTATPTGTARSCRSGSRSSPAVSACCASAPPPRWSSRRRSTASRTPSPRPARRSRRASSPAAAARSCTSPRRLRRPRPDRRRGHRRRGIVRRSLVEPLRWIAENAGLEGYVVTAKVAELSAGPRLQRRHRRVRRPDRPGRHRPGQGDPVRGDQRRVDRRHAAHHRGARRGQARGRARPPPAVTATVTATDLRPTRYRRSPPRQRGGGFSVFRRPVLVSHCALCRLPIISLSPAITGMCVANDTQG